MILELTGKNKDQISEVMNGFKEADDILIASYLKSYTDNHVLLKSLCGIMNTATSKDLTRHVKNYVSNYLLERDNDVIYQTFLREDPLRTLMDVVIENSTSRKLKIAEVAESVVPLSAHINEFVQTMGVVNLNYSIAHSKPDAMEKEKLPAGKFEVKSWDPKAPLNFKDVDLFLMKFLSCSKAEMKKILEEATATVKDNGFVALLLRTRLVPAELFLSAVGETVLSVQNEAELEQTFKALKLQVVCKKCDTLASTLYLLRKVPEVAFEDVVIPIVEDGYGQWVDKLREKMVEASTSGEQKRLWLVSEGTNSSGIVGMVNCLRQEPGGSSIR